MPRLIRCFISFLLIAGLSVNPLMATGFSPAPAKISMLRFGLMNTQALSPGDLFFEGRSFFRKPQFPLFREVGRKLASWRGEAWLDSTIFAAGVSIFAATYLFTLHLSWPAWILAGLSPSHWNFVLTWGIPGMLGVLAVFLGKNAWHALSVWSESNDTHDSVGFLVRGLASLQSVMFMVMWILGGFSSVPHLDVRDVLAAHLPAANAFEEPAMLQARGKMANILTFGSVVLAHDKFVLFSIGEDPLRLTMYDQALQEGDWRWITQALVHEITHLTAPQLDLGVQVEAADRDASARVAKMIRPELLAREEKGRKGSLFVEDFIRRGLWPSTVIKDDPAVGHDLWIMLRLQFIREEQAYHKATAFIDQRRLPGTSLRKFIAGRLEPAAAARHMTVDKMLAQFHAGRLEVSIAEQLDLFEYGLAPFFEPERITPGYEDGVLQNIVLGGEMAPLVIKYVRAEYDPHFEIPRLEFDHGYAQRFYAWFRSRILHAENEAPIRPTDKKGSNSVGDRLQNAAA